MLAAYGSFAEASAVVLARGVTPRNPRWRRGTLVAVVAPRICVVVARAGLRAFFAVPPRDGAEGSMCGTVLIMGVWSALLAGGRITKSARVVTGVIASTSRHASRRSRRWPGSGRVS